MKLVAIALVTMVLVQFALETAAAIRKSRRQALERLSGPATFFGRGAICVRCGELILPGHLVVAGPPSARGPEIEHAACNGILGRASGLPGDKRSRDSYDRDTERLLTLFSQPRMEPEPRRGSWQHRREAPTSLGRPASSDASSRPESSTNDS